MNSKKKENSNLKFKSESQDQHKHIDLQTDEILSVLDMQVSVPDGLVDEVIQKKNKLAVVPSSKIDFSKYLQIAVVLVAAIFIGVLMGKNANTLFTQKRQDPEKKALIELRDRHHLSDYNSFGKF